MKQVAGDHYERCSIQPWEVIRRNGLDYFTGNIIKYVFRFRTKNGVEDLLKAKHYLEYMIENYDQLYRSENVQNLSSQRKPTNLSTHDLSDLYRGANGTTGLPPQAPGNQLPPIYPPSRVSGTDDGTLD